MNIRKILVYLVLSMGILSFCSIPFYYVFCNYIFNDISQLKGLMSKDLNNPELKQGSLSKNDFSVDGAEVDGAEVDGLVGHGLNRGVRLKYDMVENVLNDKDMKDISAVRFGKSGAYNAKQNNLRQRKIRIYFDTDIARDLPWSIKVEKSSMNVEVGRVNLVYFYIKNVSKKDIIGYSVFDIAPRNVAQFFIKIQCFCFENQLLRAGEEVKFPLLFIVDEKILNSQVSELVMHYYFSFVKSV